MGTWPFIFRDNPGWRKCYDVYSKAVFTFFFLFIVTSYMKFVELLLAEELNFQELFANLVITLLYSVTFARVWALKSQRVKTLVKEILETENKVLVSQDPHLTKIYQSFANQSQITNMLFVVNIFIGK